jgi:hypothetical protein
MGIGTGCGRMSKFIISELPGGELILGRELTEKEDGVDDYVQFLLRKPEQKKLINWLVKNHEFELITELESQGR